MIAISSMILDTHCTHNEQFLLGYYEPTYACLKVQPWGSRRGTEHGQTGALNVLQNDRKFIAAQRARVWLGNQRYTCSMSFQAFSKIIARNKRATFDYEIERRVMAGIVLKGFEAKSVRTGNVSLKNSFATIKDGELWLNNVHIGHYDKSNISNYEPTQSRKLLVHKHELAQLLNAKTAGSTIIVLAIGTHGRFIKVELGVGRGKKKHDKRRALKKRDHDREIHKKIGLQ